MAKTRINNVDFSKYREVDTVRIQGLSGDVFQENEDGELINPISYKDAGWAKQETQTTDLYSFDFEQFVLSAIENNFYYDEVTPGDIAICGGALCFWVQEDDNGYPDDAGDYFVSYAIALYINNTMVEEDDLAELFPNFQY